MKLGKERGFVTHDELNAALPAEDYTSDQIDAANFTDLEEAWVWDGASFNAQSGRSTPSYINGVLYTVAGPRRHVVAIDPKSGETLWSYREPHTARYQSVSYTHLTLPTNREV